MSIFSLPTANTTARPLKNTETPLNIPLNYTEIPLKPLKIAERETAVTAVGDVTLNCQVQHSVAPATLYSYMTLKLTYREVGFSVRQLTATKPLTTLKLATGAVPCAREPIRGRDSRTRSPML